MGEIKTLFNYKDIFNPAVFSERRGARTSTLW